MCVKTFEEDKNDAEIKKKFNKNWNVEMMKNFNDIATCNSQQMRPGYAKRKYIRITWSYACFVFVIVLPLLKVLSKGPLHT